MLPWRPAAGLPERGAPGRPDGADLKYSIMKVSYTCAQRLVYRAFRSITSSCSDPRWSPLPLPLTLSTSATVSWCDCHCFRMKISGSNGVQLSPDCVLTSSLSCRGSAAKRPRVCGCTTPRCSGWSWTAPASARWPASPPRPTAAASTSAPIPWASSAGACCAARTRGSTTSGAASRSCPPTVYRMRRLPPEHNQKEPQNAGSHGRDGLWWLRQLV